MDNLIEQNIPELHELIVKAVTKLGGKNVPVDKVVSEVLRAGKNYAEYDIEKETIRMAHDKVLITFGVSTKNETCVSLIRPDKEPMPETQNDHNKNINDIIGKYFK